MKTLSNDVHEVIMYYNKKDHFEILNELAFAMRESADKVQTIRDEFDIVGVRKALPSDLARIYITLQALKVNLSVMDGEWEKELNKEAAKILESEVNFEEVEF